MFFKIKVKNKENGSIAITGVIIVSTILLVSGIALIATSVDFIRATKEIENDFINKSASVSCLEESLYKLSGQKTYTGTISLTLTSTTCQAVITTDSGNSSIKNVNITSTTDNHTYNELIQVDISGSSPAIIE